jgi:hypothetical protein
MKLPTVTEDPMEVNEGVVENQALSDLELGLQISIWHAYFSRNLNIRSLPASDEKCIPSFRHHYS